MAAKGGIWTKNGFVKSADRKNDGGGAVAVAEDNDPAMKLNSSIATDLDEKIRIADEAYRLYREADRQLEDVWDRGESSQLLEENRGILYSVSSFLETDAHLDDTVGVIVKDKNGKTQAVSAVDLRPDSVYVEFLATHPDNILKDNPNRVKGGGSQAMARIAKLAQERGVNKIELTPLDSAIPFYEKLGFKPSDNPDSSYYYTLKGSDLDKLADRAR